MSAPITPPRRTTSIPANNALASSSKRPESPSPSTSGFSLIGADEAEGDAEDYSFWSYNTSTPYKGFGSFGRRAAIYSTPTLNYFSSSIPFPSSSGSGATPPASSSSPGSSLKSLFPRIWDVLISSPTRNIISTSSRPSLSPQTFASPNHSEDTYRHSMLPNYSSYPQQHTPTMGRLTKGKGRAYQSTSRVYQTEQVYSGGVEDFWMQDDSLDRSSTRHSISSQYSYINFSDLAPLDGEEGELIEVDDEACFLPADHFRFGGTTWRGKGSFSRARVVTGMDILAMLPTEVALHVLNFVATGTSYRPFASPSYHTPRNSAIWAARTAELLNPYLPETFYSPEQSLQNLLICASVSKTWHQLALDNSVWRTMFECRWGHGESGGGLTKDSIILQAYSVKKSNTSIGRDKRLPALPTEDGAPPPPTVEPSALNYFTLYQDRLEMDRRWAGTAFTKCVSSACPSPAVSQVNLTPPASRSSSLTPMYAADTSASSSSTFTFSRSSLSASTVMDLGSRYSRALPNLPSELAEHWDKWEPDVVRLGGHSDSVYCIELPSSTTFAADKFFITGSRDRTIKMWSANTAKCIGTFGRGRVPRSSMGDTLHDDRPVEMEGHAGSVLCLKFIWSEADDDSSDELSSMGDSQKVVVRKGMMFSGSSDCTILVWDVRMESLGPNADGLCPNQYNVKARVRTVLRGHSGGVLDLRVNDDWIVSCSKDTTIRVWNRRTLTAHRTLRGHEGPVNAVGMEYGKVVSASGDGKMILWDVGSGERLRTFEGHDRGLACIEFSNGLIISGSNDCKIKIWSAYTGKCLRTLHGHDNLVRALAFDPARGLLVSASYDKSVRVWDIKDVLNGGESAREGDNENRRIMLRVFRNAHTSHIFDVKFDVGRIVSSSHDQKIVVADFSRGLESANLFL